MTDRRALLLTDAEAPVRRVFPIGADHWALPLDNLLMPTVVQDVARWSGGGVAAFGIELERAWEVLGLVLAGHTLGGDARFRLTWATDAAFTQRVVRDPADGGWRLGHGRIRATRRLPWRARNFWSGRGTDWDFRGYTRSVLRLTERPVWARFCRVEIDNRGRDFDLGLLLVATGFRADWSIRFGREIDPGLRTAVEETRGGRRIADRQPSARGVTVTYADLSYDEALGVLDIVKAIDRTGPVVVVPDPGVASRNLWREVFAATLDPQAKPALRQAEDGGGLWSVALSVKEIIG